MRFYLFGKLYALLGKNKLTKSAERMVICDIYKTEHGAIYLGVTLSVLPLLIVYFVLSKHIIAGVALGGVKG